LQLTSHIAVMTNLRRIQRYLESSQSKKGTDKTVKACQGNPFFVLGSSKICSLVSLYIVIIVL
jgi:hypothetical protein